MLTEVESRKPFCVNKHNEKPMNSTNLLYLHFYIVGFCQFVPFVFIIDFCLISLKYCKKKRKKKEIIKNAVNFNE